LIECLEVGHVPERWAADFRRAWDACDELDPVLRLLAHADVRGLIAAACGCARRALDCAPPDAPLDGLCRRAIVVAEAWIHDRASAAEVDAAGMAILDDLASGPCPEVGSRANKAASACGNAAAAVGCLASDAAINSWPELTFNHAHAAVWCAIDAEDSPDREVSDACARMERRFAAVVRAVVPCPSFDQARSAAHVQGDAWAAQVRLVLAEDTSDPEDYPGAHGIGRALARAVAIGGQHSWIRACFARIEEALAHGPGVSRVRPLVAVGVLEALWNGVYHHPGTDALESWMGPNTWCAWRTLYAQ